ncbi:hypothetical protein PROVRETT_06767 [Providencia rettgeri DSM 1131]|nr:hypothetical protein PROVRETT_06767 [Providencia rettgeri DSM 1131]
MLLIVPHFLIIKPTTRRLLHIQQASICEAPEAYNKKYSHLYLIFFKLNQIKYLHLVVS